MRRSRQKGLPEREREAALTNIEYSEPPCDYRASNAPTPASDHCERPTLPKMRPKLLTTVRETKNFILPT